MIHVIATISLKPGVRADYLEILKSNIPNVLAEDGCLGYAAATDTDSGLEIQEPLRDDAVVIVEKWESLEALHTHLGMPHMADYKAKVVDMVTGVSLQVLESVS
jgi:quinol monooxygenase YgiN